MTDRYPSRQILIVVEVKNVFKMSGVELSPATLWTTLYISGQFQELMGKFYIQMTAARKIKVYQLFICHASIWKRIAVIREKAAIYHFYPPTSTICAPNDPNVKILTDVPDLTKIVLRTSL